jgi:hypothetical protein
MMCFLIEKNGKNTTGVNLISVKGVRDQVLGSGKTGPMVLGEMARVIQAILLILINSVVQGADIFSEIFRGNSHFDPSVSRKANSKKKREVSRDAKYRLKVPFVEAAVGIKKKVTLSDDKTVNMTIPCGGRDRD